MSTDTRVDTPYHGFRRGHRVRFANGPVMTVMNYTEGEYDEPLVLCGWWLDNDLECAAFHPDVLIHAQEADVLLVKPPSPDEFQEFHSE